MTVVGSAEILILPLTTGFESELKKQTAGGFKGFAKDSEAAGLAAAAGLRGGVTKETSALAGDLEKHGHAAGSKLASTLTLGFAGAVVAAGVFSGKVAMSMQSAEASIAAASGTSVASAARIGLALESSAGKSEFSAVEMAKAYAGVAGQLKETEGRALSSKQALTVMSAASDLASAKQIELGTATSAVAGIMQAFQLKTRDAAHVSDVLFKASAATGQGVDTLANQLEKVRSKLGETAGSVGNLAGLLVDMTDQGITGRAAMSALNGAMNTLLKPTKQATEESKKLGLQTFDSSGKFVGLGKVIEELHPKLAKLTEQQRLQAVTALFGTSAGRQMLAVIQAGPAAFDKASQAVNRHGQAQSAAAKQASTLRGEEHILGAEASNLAGRIGTVLIPIVTAMIGGFTKATTFVLGHKAALIALGVVVTGILGPAIAVFTVNKMAAFSSSFKDASGHVKSFATDVEGVVKRVVKAFGLQDEAAATSATNIGTASGEASGAVAAEATEIEASSTAVDASFAGTATAADAAAGGIGAAETTTVGEVTAADTTIETENAAAAASFAGLDAAAGGGAALGAAGVAGLGGLAFGGVAAIENTFGTPNSKAHYTSRATGQQVYNPRAAAFLGPNAIAKLPVPGLGGSPASIPGPVLLGPGAAHSHTHHAGDVSGSVSKLSSRIHTGHDVMAKAASGGTLTKSQLEALWIQAGGPPSEANTAASIALAESSGNVGAQGDVGLGGSGPTSFGLWQIHTPAHPQYNAAKLASNPLYNAEAAVAVSGHGSTFTPWSTFNSGAYRQFLGQSASPGSAGALPSPGSVLTAAQNVGQSAAQTLASERGQLAKVIAQETAQLNRKIAAEKAGVSGKGHSAEEKARVAQEIADQKGALAVEVAQQKAALGELTASQKAELKKQTTDAKAGSADLKKLLGDVHSTNLKQLTSDLNKTHNASLHRLERSLSDDHNAALRTLEKELVAVHREAMANLVKQDAKAAAAAAAAKAITDAQTHDTLLGDWAKTAADQIADATKVKIDKQGEAGLTGAALTAAQAQTNFDQVAAASNQAVDLAQAGVDQAANASPAKRQAAADALTQAQANATVNNAAAQSTLDLANAAANAANNLNNVAAAPAAPPTVENNFTINGSGLDAHGVMTEITWGIKNGVLPVAPPPLVPA